MTGQFSVDSKSSENFSIIGLMSVDSRSPEYWILVFYIKR